MTNLSERSTREVFERHLQLRAEGRLEDDLLENYSSDVILMVESNVLKGHSGIRHSAERLKLQLPRGRYEFKAKLVEGEYAFLIWRAQSDLYSVEDGADSFVIRNGKIVMQTIYYRLSNYRSEGFRPRGEL